MRNLDSVLFEIGNDHTTGVVIQPLSNPRLGAATDRVGEELRLLASAVLKLTVVAALTFAIAWLTRQLHGWQPAAEYTEAAMVPLLGGILAAMWTSSLRLIIEPRRVSAPTLLLMALCAYPAAWMVRAYVVGASLPGVDWIVASKATDLGSHGQWAMEVLAAELALTVVLGTAWTRWYLGPQKD
jgi:hypothetical protein